MEVPNIWWPDDQTSPATVHWLDGVAAGRRAALRAVLRHRFGAYGAGASFDPITSRIAGYERIYLGQGVFIGPFAMLSAAATVSIGDDTVIGPGFTLMTGDHIYSRPGVAYRETIDANRLPVTIGRNVWIGAAVTVLKGVTVGDAAIIAAGAVVTRNVPAFAIAMGVPARVSNWRFEGEERSKHLTFIERHLRQPGPAAEEHQVASG